MRLTANAFCIIVLGDHVGATLANCNSPEAFVTQRSSLCERECLAWQSETSRKIWRRDRSTCVRGRSIVVQRAGGTYGQWLKMDGFCGCQFDVDCGDYYGCTVWPWEQRGEANGRRRFSTVSCWRNARFSRRRPRRARNRRTSVPKQSLTKRNMVGSYKRTLVRRRQLCH
jgi:hypothetical protein